MPGRRRRCKGSRAFWCDEVACSAANVHTAGVNPREPRPPGGREVAAPLVCAGLAACLAGLMIVGARDFALDDAWIHLAYAKSLRLGDGLSYNPGDWETGVSSPLWVALLAIWPIAGNPVVPVKLLGVLLHALTAWAGASIVLDVTRERATLERPLPVMSLTLLAGTLVASTPTLVHAATSGMEVPLASALVLLAIRTALRGHVAASAVLGLLCVWARPEALFVLLAFGPALALHRWKHGADTPRLRAPIAAALAGALALGAWVLYCLAVSGHPWPNTWYVKGPGGGLDGLDYVRLEVLPLQPWIVSLTGLVLLGLAVREDLRSRRPEAAVLLVTWLVAVVAIAVGRPLHPGVQFYESRYFAFVAALPMLVVPLGVAATQAGSKTRPWTRWAALALALPVGLLCGLQVHHLRAALLEQVEDTHVLHSAVGRFVAEQLPPDAVVGVEGAGAPRFHAPRSMTIVDLVGLNEREAAHRHFDVEAKICWFVGRDLTHVAIPTDWIGIYGQIFELRALAEFVDPHYTQVLPPRPVTVVVFAVEGVRPAWRQRCEG